MGRGECEGRRKLARQKVPRHRDDGSKRGKQIRQALLCLSGRQPMVWCAQSTVHQ